MRILKNKSKTYTIALILALTIALTFIAAIPFTSGQTTAKINTDAEVYVTPWTIGLSASTHSMSDQSKTDRI